jgi:DNA-binding CsgD family transcriptional regulator
MKPLDLEAWREAVATAAPEVRAVLAERHETERLGGHRVWVGLEHVHEDGQRTELQWQPRLVRSCAEHGQQQCSQCRNGAWLQASRRMPVVRPVEDEVLNVLCPPPTDPRVAHVETVLTGVSDADRQLAWTMAAGLTGPEAAEALGLSHGTVRTRLHRLRRRLVGCNTFSHTGSEHLFDAAA